MTSPSDPHALTLLLRKLESIGELSAEDRQAILTLPVRTQVLRPKQDILHEGDKPSHCCVVLDGWLYRYKLLGEGRRQILSFHMPGDVPDLQSLHLHTMGHSLGAVTRATVAFISHDALLDLISRSPTIAALLWRDTLINAAISCEWMTGMGRRNAYERIAHLFCELYVRLEAVGLAADYRCPLPLTQIDLSDALGLTSVHVNRVLKELRGSGLITLKSSTLEITSWEEMTRACEFDPTYLHLAKRPTD